MSNLLPDDMKDHMGLKGFINVEPVMEDPTMTKPEGTHSERMDRACVAASQTSTSTYALIAVAEAIARLAEAIEGRAEPVDHPGGPAPDADSTGSPGHPLQMDSAGKWV